MGEAANLHIMESLLMLSEVGRVGIYALSLSGQFDQERMWDTHS